MNASQESDFLVLLVDDDPSVRRVAALSLKSLGYRVIQANDGSSALAMLESGEHAVRLVSRRWPRISVLLTSGHAREDDFADIEAVQLLNKPYSRAALAQAISSALQTP